MHSSSCVQILRKTKNEETSIFFKRKDDKKKPLEVEGRRKAGEVGRERGGDREGRDEELWAIMFTTRKSEISRVVYS